MLITNCNIASICWWYLLKILKYLLSTIIINKICEKSKTVDELNYLITFDESGKKIWFLLSFHINFVYIFNILLFSFCPLIITSFTTSNWCFLMLAPLQESTLPPHKMHCQNVFEAELIWISKFLLTVFTSVYKSTH